MAVSLKPKFTAGQIKAAIAERVNLIDQAILLRLQRVGERFVRNARSVDTYKDQTGNLRSSKGYVILKNGEQIYENFKTQKGGKKGVDEAKKIVNEAIANFPRGYVIIGVAGMDYAAAVESKGLDVITGSSKVAEADLKKAITELSNKLGKGK